MMACDALRYQEDIRKVPFMKYIHNVWPTFILYYLSFLLSLGFWNWLLDNVPHFLRKSYKNSLIFFYLLL